MKKTLSKSIIGYKRCEVESYIKALKDDYENELSRKMERIIELNDNVHKMKDKINMLTEELEKYKNKEKYIAEVLIKAEAKAQAIEEEGKRKYSEELTRIELDKERWKYHFEDSKQKVKELEKRAIDVLEKFKAEVTNLDSQEFLEIVDVSENVAYTVDNKQCETEESEMQEQENFDIIEQQYQDKESNLADLCRELGIYENYNND